MGHSVVNEVRPGAPFDFIGARFNMSGGGAGRGEISEISERLLMGGCAIFKTLRSLQSVFSARIQEHSGLVQIRGCALTAVVANTLTMSETYGLFIRRYICISVNRASRRADIFITLSVIPRQSAPCAGGVAYPTPLEIDDSVRYVDDSGSCEGFMVLNDTSQRNPE
ncbi:hypothetical protein EVAR_32736_1 [Eumeta japonica]|uniref:Uncharacterized protein n=1 Tax=Eumeta variegata TaxID=151549 RepID=A0A4C1XM77_EUMVA|nr:hypothetical protein EVAR_32736_1 [Eumeta japonica]